MKIIYNPIELTIKSGTIVTKYKTKHAFNTAWLHSRIVSERIDYQTYKRKYNAINGLRKDVL